MVDLLERLETVEALLAMLEADDRGMIHACLVEQRAELLATIEDAEAYFADSDGSFMEVAA